jgi:amidase
VRAEQVPRQSYAKCQSLTRTQRAGYDAVLRDHDLLPMPTLPLKATPIAAPAAPRLQIIPREGRRS